MDGRDLKLYEQRNEEVQSLRSENRFLRDDRDHYRKEWLFAKERNNPLKERFETHQDVPLPQDSAGRPSCSDCNGCLQDMEHHEHMVEHIIPTKVAVTCYHTSSGGCPGCRKRIESRALEQPQMP